MTTLRPMLITMVLLCSLTFQALAQQHVSRGCAKHQNAAVITDAMAAHSTMAMHGDRQAAPHDCCDTECDCPSQACHAASGILPERVLELSDNLINEPFSRRTAVQPTRTFTSIYRPPIIA